MINPPPAAHVWLNGRILDSTVPHLSVYDRGFQLGDGVFEALRARRGVAIELEGHLARMHVSLAGLDFELPFGDEVVASGVRELLSVEGWDRAEPAADAVIRITVSRGFDPTRGVLPHPGGTASVAIQAWPFVPPDAEVLAAGERVITSAVRRDTSSPMAAIKTTSRAELVFARLEARRAGAADAIFVTTSGLVTEATTSNVLVIKGDTCVTPRLGTALLAGTTRAWLVGHGQATTGLRMLEADLPIESLFEADEMATCSSIAGVVPVTSVDGRPIGQGRPGRWTMALRAAREEWIDRLSLAGRDQNRDQVRAAGTDSVAPR